MTFPIEFLTDVPLWYNWVGNIGAIIIFIVAIIITVAFDDCDDKEEEVKFVLGIMAVGLVVSMVWATGWGIITALLIPGIVVYIIRRGFWGIKDLIFYIRHDR